MTKNDAFLGKRLQLQNNPSPFILEKSFLSISNQFIITTTKSHG